MATVTTNLGLSKPAASDNVSIDTINNNMDILDTAVGKIGDGLYIVLSSSQYGTTLPANATLGRLFFKKL